MGSTGQRVRRCCLPGGFLHRGNNPKGLMTLPYAKRVRHPRRQIELQLPLDVKARADLMEWVEHARGITAPIRRLGHRQVIRPLKIPPIVERPQHPDSIAGRRRAFAHSLRQETNDLECSSSHFNAPLSMGWRAGQARFGIRPRYGLEKKSISANFGLSCKSSIGGVKKC